MSYKKMMLMTYEVQTAAMFKALPHTPKWWE